MAGGKPVLGVTPSMLEMRAAVKSYREIAEAIGRPKATVIGAFARASYGGVPAKAAPAPTAQAARTLADFRRDHDQAWKIRDGLKRLFGGGVIMTDAEFREAVNGNPSRWRAAADQAEFKQNRYRVSGELLWAAADTIAEMRRIRGEAV